MLTDTKRLETIFSGLAEKLTGERMTVSVEIGPGHVLGLTGANVSWAPSGCYGQYGEPRSKLAVPAGLRGAIEREPAGFVRQ